MGLPKMDRSWGRGLTECGPLEKGMANHFSILALRTPWKDELPRSVGDQYATGDQWRNNSRKNEGMEPKQKQYMVSIVKWVITLRLYCMVNVANIDILEIVNSFFQWSCMDVRVGLWRKLSAKEWMLLNCGVWEDSWESLGLQGDPTSPFWRRSALGFLWKEWC